MKAVLNKVNLDGRVAVVTGGGGGLGREHALLLANRGAAVVVNDVGGALDGTGADSSAAQSVVDEVIACGGIAVSDTNSVSSPEGGEAIVSAAVDNFGRVDIVINNAGILRDKAFHNLAPEFVDALIDVHLRGAFHVTRPAWRHFRAQEFGRVINTSSAAGVFGNFGQANYAAVKAGLIGLTRVLALEGAKFNITANAIAPIARTRMTTDLLGKLADRLDPRLVAPVVAWLVSEDCHESGNIYTVGGGRIARYFVSMSRGWTRTDGELTPEDVRDHWEQINNISDSTVPEQLSDDFRALT